MPTVREELVRWLEGAERVVVLGLGSPLRRDDFVGVAVVRELRRLLAERARKGEEAAGRVLLLEGGSAPENVLGLVARAGPSHVLIIDAADLGREPGSVALIRPEEAGSSHPPSTHTLPLRFLCSYLASLTRARLLVLGVQPKDLGLGEGLSSDVAKAARRLAELLAELLPS